MGKVEIIKSALKFLVQKQIEQGSWGFSDAADDDEISWDEVIGWLEQEPCKDCISREQAVYVASGYCEPQNIADELRKLPSVKPQPKRGKWIFNENMHDYCCSECGCLMPNVNEYYRKKIIGCPYCLADMREVKADGNDSDKT